MRGGLHVLKEEDLQALFVIINEPDKLESVLEILLDCEIRGATILDTQGMAKVLSNRIPVYLGLRSLIGDEHERNKTIFALSKHPDKIDQAIERISDMFHSFERACTGMMFVVPVLKAVGFGQKFSQDTIE